MVVCSGVVVCSGADVVCSGVAMCAGVSAVPCEPSIPLFLGEASAVAAATFFTAPDAESFPRTTPLPGTLTPRGATCASRCPDARAAADVFGEELCVICSAPVTAAPPATVTATTAAAAFIATPPAKNPPLAAPPEPTPTPVAVPAPTPVVAVLAPVAEPVAGTRCSVAAFAVPAPSSPLNSESDSGMGINRSPRSALL